MKRFDRKQNIDALVGLVADVDTVLRLTSATDRDYVAADNVLIADALVAVGD